MKNTITAFLLLLVSSVRAQSFDLNTSNDEIITVLFGGKWDDENKHCVWLPINEEEEAFFTYLKKDKPTILHTREWVDYKYPKKGTEHRIILTETISNKHSYCHASAIGVSRILLEYDKTTEKWDVLSFDRMWHNIGSWGELDHVTIELQRVGEYDYLLHESTWYNTTFYDIFYSEQGDRLQIETGDQRCGHDEDDIFLCWFYNTEISIDERESTITFQKKTTLEYERGNEYVYETSVYKVIDGKFIKQE